MDHVVEAIENCLRAHGRWSERSRHEMQWVCPTDSESKRGAARQAVAQCICEHTQCTAEHPRHAASQRSIHPSSRQGRWRSIVDMKALLQTRGRSVTSHLLWPGLHRCFWPRGASPSAMACRDPLTLHACEVGYAPMATTGSSRQKQGKCVCSLAFC